MIIAHLNHSDWKGVYAQNSRKDRYTMLNWIINGIPMKLTKAQKNIIRRHWFDRRLKFMADGTVMARKSPNQAWGVLYRPDETRKHLVAVGLWSEADAKQAQAVDNAKTLDLLSRNDREALEELHQLSCERWSEPPSYQAPQQKSTKVRDLLARNDPGALGELQRMAIEAGIATMETDAETVRRRMKRMIRED